MATYSKIEFKKRDVRLKDVPKFLQGLIENKVSIGVHSTQDRRPKGKSNVDIGFINEFGLQNVPARPFVRLYLYPEKTYRVMNEYRNRYNEQIKQGLKTPIKSAKDILNDVGRIGQTEMRDIILSNTMLTPNAPLTIELKGFDYPLVETGRLVNAIKYKVEKS